MSPEWAGFVTKPFDIATFTETIRGSLATAQQHTLGA
jgi:hypothetical protein